MARRPVTVRAVHPSAAVEEQLRRRLLRLVDEMQSSLVYWLRATYRANEPEMAADESPAVALRNAMRALTRRWTREFAKMAAKWGPDFGRNAKQHVDVSFAAALKKAGFTVGWRATPAVNDVLQASITQSVGLIKSIASEHLQEVEGLVMRSVTAGRDLGALTDELASRHAITRRRAAFIARDQNNKASAAIVRARQDELGVVEALWLHSHGGKVPRPTHVAMNGKRYPVKQGMWDPAVKRYIFPGEEPNCRCASRSIIPGLTK